MLQVKLYLRLVGQSTSARSPRHFIAGFGKPVPNEITLLGCHHLGGTQVRECIWAPWKSHIRTHWPFRRRHTQLVLVPTEMATTDSIGTMPAAGTYRIVNRVLSPTGDKLAITYNGQGSAATVTPSTASDDTQLVGPRRFPIRHD